MVAVASSIHESARRNALLNALSPAGLERLQPEYRRVTVGEQLIVPLQSVKHLHFPTTAIVAMCSEMADGSSTGLGLFGSDSATGLVVLAGRKWSMHSKVVQGPGVVFRVRSEAVQREFDSDTGFRNAVLSSIEKVSHQVGQISLCNRLHSVEERFIRWILLTLDYSKGDTVRMTHQFMSEMIGANRSTVTMTARRLQEIGCIRYSHGRIIVTDRAVLESHGCECYGVIRRSHS